MKKLILIISLLITTVSCNDLEVKTIETFKNKGIVVIEKIVYYQNDDVKFRVKTKDSIFFIRLTEFDAKNLKIGDTIK